VAQAIDALTAGHCGGFREPEYRARVETGLETQKAATVDVVASTTQNVFTPGREHDVFTATALRDFIVTEIETVEENVRGPVSLAAVAWQFACAAHLPRIWRAMSPGETGAVAERLWCDIYGAVLSGKPLAEAVREAARSSRAKG